MAKVDFQYIKTGTGELSGPSFVAQTEQAINELGSFIEESNTTANNAQAAAEAAQQAAEQAQQTANSAVSDAQQSMTAAQTAQQAAEQAQATADNALEAAQSAGDTAGTKAPIMHASAATTYGVGSSALYGHVQLSDATNGTENAANGGTAATPHAVAQAMTAAQTAQSTANSAQQTAQSAQQAANAAQSTANSAQQTANQTQTALDQAFENFDQQISALSNQNLFTVQDEAIAAETYAGGRYRLYLESTASASTGLPSGISYPCFFWTEAGEDGDTSMMYVLSNNMLYSQSGVNTTPDGETDTWTFTGWQQVTYTAATTSALGVVKPDGTTVEVSSDGTLSINSSLLSTVYKFKGSVATKDDLPTGAAQGDVYNVTDTDANYAWTGSTWDNIGGIEAVDPAPVSGSSHPVASGGVYTALNTLQTTLEGQIEQVSEAIPIALTQNKKFYVNAATGSDTLSPGRGESLDTPFKTIQAALNYVTARYNMGAFIASLSLADGIYTENVNLPKYSATTGSIEIKGNSSNRGNVIIQGCVAGTQNVGRWDLQYLTIQNRSGLPSIGSANYYGVFSQSGATIYLRNCAMDVSAAAPSGQIKVPLYAGGGNIQIRSLDGSAGLSIVDDGEGTTSRVLCGDEGGSISMLADIDLSVSVSVAVLFLAGLSQFSVTVVSGTMPQFTGSATGKRYDVRENSIASTFGSGPEFIPGTIAGTTSTGGQYT